MAKPNSTPDENKSLFLLFYILFCQRVVALDNANRNIGIENVGNADGEVLFTLSSDKLPFAFEAVGLMVDHTHTAFSGFVLPYETNVKIGTTLSDNTHLTVKTPSDGQRSVDPIFPVTSEPVKFKVNLCPRTGLPEGVYRSQQNNNKYGKQPFHGAKIRQNVEMMDAIISVPS